MTVKTGRLTGVAVAVLITAAPALTAPSAGAAEPAPSPWELSSQGDRPRSDYLNDVTAVDARTAWASGFSTYDNGGRYGAMLRWDGAGWRDETTKGLPERDYWHSVSATARDDVWAYGWGADGEEGDGSDKAVRFDGERWHDTHLPDLPDGAGHGWSDLAAVRGRVWLAGGQWISTYEKGTWKQTSVGADHDILDIHARNRHDAWAVGSYIRSGTSLPPLVMHWNGKHWTDVKLPDMPLRLTSVYAESANSVWAAGFETSLEPGYVPKVLHWDGKAWKDATGPVTDLEPLTISGDGRGTVWLAGDENGFEGAPVYWRHTKKGWTETRGPKAPGQTHAYRVNALAPAGRSGRLWAVGTYSLVTGETTALDRGIVWRSRR